jgi:integrase/recombinase XerC
MNTEVEIVETNEHGEMGLTVIRNSSPVPVLSTDELLQSFLSGKSPRTVEAYKRDLADFQAFLEAPSMDVAARTFLSGGLSKANHIALKYKTFLSDQKKLQPTTVNRKLAALRSLTDMAHMLGLVNWKLNVRNLKVFSASRDTRGPGRTGVQKIQDEVSKRIDPKGIRDQAIFHRKRSPRSPRLGLILVFTRLVGDFQSRDIAHVFHTLLTRCQQ